ncbi:glycosyltransferase family 4 protein [Tepidiphilus baoligensis]|uniref:Glycosyltransferase n=1 Tax=Tepidiphilus baoligensis TaxID=2698687 RepID=A0ABX1QNQ3_9PROT|nr:glycosyltransferase family 4 protein [Tepidiphilus baoligensis]NMH17352.1 glycosyltransferase [Tepidiphilus baoligensis]
MRISLIGNQAFSLLNFRGALIRDLVAAGVEVFAFAPDYDGDAREKVRALGAEPVDFSITRSLGNPVREVKDILDLARTLRRLRIDVCFSFIVKVTIYATLAARLAGVPRRVAMLEGLGFTFIEEEGKTSLRKRLIRQAVVTLGRLSLPMAKPLIVLNPDDEEMAIRLRWAKPENVVCLGGIGVDLDQWRPAPPVTEPVTFLLAARLLREKGIVEYVEAARRVKARHPQVRFVLLGGLDDNPGALTESEVRRWVQEGTIEWPGHVPVQPWLAQASVYVLPSYYREGVPRSTQEAMAMGRPVITTDAPGCRETVVDGVNGFLVPVRDAEALAQRMLWFVAHPEAIGPMGAQSRRLAEERFDVREINRRLMALLGVERVERE